MKEPILVGISGTNLWELHEEYQYQTKNNGLIIIPQGFVCDLASIPRPFWVIVGHPAGEFKAAAVVHDFLYRTQLFKRSICDKIFLEAMEELKVSYLKRNAMYGYVRSFGWIPWKINGKNSFKVR